MPAEILVKRYSPDGRGRFEIDVPTVSRELFEKTRRVVEATGYTFFTRIRAVSIDDLLAEDAIRRKNGEKGKFGNVASDVELLRGRIPPEMEVAINPNKVKIEGSNIDPYKDKEKYLSPDQIIRKEENMWKTQLPEDIRSLVRMFIPDPSTLAQLDLDYQARTGGPLFREFFAEADLGVFHDQIAAVGRHNLDITVTGWNDSPDYDKTYVVPVVVLPRISMR